MKYKKILPLLLSGAILLGGCNAAATIPSDTSDVSETSIEETQSPDAESSASESQMGPGQGSSSISEADMISLSNTSNALADIEAVKSFDEALIQEAEILVVTDNQTINVSQGGTYILSGKASGYSLVVNAPDEKVNLILNGVNLSSNDGPVINIIEADKVTLSVVEGTTNTISDTNQYTDDTLSAAIYSKADLVINGKGQLTVNGAYNNAIQSKDDLKVTEVELHVTSVDDGLIGKDKVEVYAANLTFEVSGDAIKSTNEEDAEKGYVSIVNSVILIEAGSDGIQSETHMQILGSNLTINSGKDAIHSNQSLWVESSDAIINAEDDALHSETELTIVSGNILVESSYEGIESALINIAGGQIEVHASDDGINVAGGNDGDTTGNNTAYLLTISGGDITVYAEGDGLDANGSIYQTGGDVIVYGPTGNGNGALDYDRDYIQSGGSIIAIGSAGMAMLPSTSSEVVNFMYSSTDVIPSGTPIELSDAKGNVILETTTQKTSQTIVFADESLEEGTTYALAIGSLDVTINLETTGSAFDADGNTVTVTGHGFGGGGFGQGDKGTRDGHQPPSGGQFPEGQADRQLPQGQDDRTIPENNNNQ